MIKKMIKKCELCRLYVGITNDLDYTTHLSECSQHPDHLPCHMRLDKTCDHIQMRLMVASGGELSIMTDCSKVGCFKSIETTLFLGWEVGVPEPGTLKTKFVK